MIQPKNTKELLADSLTELMHKKRADKITAKDIAANCGVSTATFYNHFIDKNDLILWVYTRYSNTVFSEVGTALTWAEGFTRCNRFVEDNWVYFKNAALNTLTQNAGQNSFFAASYKNMVQLTIQTILLLDEEVQIDDELLFTLRFFFHAVGGLCLDWYNGKFPLSAEEFSKRCLFNMPERLKKLLRVEE